VQAETTVYNEYLQLAAEAASQPERPTFIVLPEHAIYDYADERHPTIRALAELARQNGVYVCVGVHSRAEPGSACDYDNVALLIDSQGRIVGRQAKSVPVPFFDDGNPAQSQETVQTPWGRTGTYICYDATFTDLPRRLVDLGAELLLAPLMDPEPWPVQQRWQHADMAPFRSIELRRCAVRAASSGVSQIIDTTGRVRRQRTREQGPGIICGPVHFATERTLFVRGRHLFATAVGAAFLVTVTCLTLADWRSKIGRRRAGPRSPDPVIADDSPPTTRDADA
jgi:apolipoprotein N-acyltransferase